MSNERDECAHIQEKEIATPAIEIKPPKIEVEVQPQEIKVEIKSDEQPERDPNKQYIGSGKDRITININEPEWDGNTFAGRLKNYMAPRRLSDFFAGSEALNEAKETVRKYL